MTITNKENMIYAEAEYKTWEQKYNITRLNVFLGGFVVGVIIGVIILILRG